MSGITKKLIRWYKSNKRDLPWREEGDPYLIWLSEILLQQTRVSQGLPYYFKFKEAFPDIFSLANAEEQKVLKLWQGLGYYSRARNMLFAAKFIVNNLGGKFPGCYNDLVLLKGIGNYTAAAISSFAYDEKVAVVDGNVMRVLARLFGIEEDTRKGTTVKRITEIANELLPDQECSIFNQAIMEFGALHCKPSSPLCEICPLSEHCFAYNNKCQHRLPYKSKAKVKKDRHFNYLVIETDAGILMKRRSEDDIWAGLYDFPLYERENLLCAEDIDKILPQFEINQQQVVFSVQSKTFKHVLTHQNIYACFWHVKVDSVINVADIEDIALYKYEEINELPKPVLINNYLSEHIF